MPEIELKKEVAVQKAEQVTCWNCRQSGHLSRDCHNRRKSGTCFLCKVVGHFKSECPDQG